MRVDPGTLDQAQVDVLVIGGGIQGAAMAREAAVRGASTLLVEGEDFGAGTSSQSSRLIHGGLRYLEHGHLTLVREALHERERLLRLAPHLVRPLPMLMPFYRGGSRSPWVVKTGLRLYGWLAGRSSLPGPRSHSPADCARLFPGIRTRDLRGGSVFYDARTVDQRLTMAVVEAAAEAGAKVANHVAAVGFAGRHVLLRDRLTDREVRVSATHILNAAGPGVDRVRRALGVEGADLIRLSRGSHLVLDPRPGEVALAAFLPDRRIQFVVPHPDGTLCGTTEAETETDEGPVPAEDVEYLLDALAYLLEEPPGPAQIRHAYVGWRALPTGRGPAGGANREAFLVPEPSPAGTIQSVVGGKLTTHRSFAERAVSGLLGVTTPSPTRTAFLPGGDGPQDFGDPLWWRHGSRAAEVRALGEARPALLAPICPHRELLRVELAYAIRSQATMTFADLMLRRLFHSQGPCLHESCLRAAYALFAELVPDAARAALPDARTALAEIAAAVAAVYATPHTP